MPLPTPSVLTLQSKMVVTKYQKNALKQRTVLSLKVLLLKMRIKVRTKRAVAATSIPMPKDLRKEWKL